LQPIAFKNTTEFPIHNLRGTTWAIEGLQGFYLVTTTNHLGGNGWHAVFLCAYMVYHYTSYISKNNALDVNTTLRAPKVMIPSSEVKKLLDFSFSVMGQLVQEHSH
jgi:hypothetical protein